MALAEKYLEGEEITEAEFMMGIRKATLSHHFCGRDTRHGLQEQGYSEAAERSCELPSRALSIFRPQKGHSLEDESQLVEVGPDDSDQVVGLAFKLFTDPYVGKLVFFRIYRGTLSKGSTLYNSRTGKAERVSRLMVMHADRREDIDQAFSGDIVAIIGAKDVRTGDTLADKNVDVVLGAPDIPGTGYQHERGTGLQG
jgi:elongation factor G